MPIIRKTNTQNLNSTDPKGFKRNGPVARVLKEFDQKLTATIADTLQLENNPLSRAEKEKRTEELRKNPLPNEHEFEKKLAKAYRQDYGQPIPKAYLKQAVRSIKNLLERVRFYTYSPYVIAVADYAPPMAKKAGGKKFTELDNKSWASISEPGDERYPGWYQSKTRNEDIITWLEEGTSSASPKPEKPSSELSEDEHEVLGHQSQKRHRSPDSARTTSKRQNQSSPERLSSPPSEHSNRTPLFHPHSPGPRAEEEVTSPVLFPAFEDDRHLENDFDLFLNAPTPGSPILFNDDFSAMPYLYSENHPSPPFVSRPPTPGLNFYDELVRALKAEPRSTEDIVHYFVLAHQGRPEQKARALFRLSRDLEQAKPIVIDRYLHGANGQSPGSGTSSRARSPIQIFNVISDVSDPENTDESSKLRGRSHKPRKAVEPRAESRQRMMDEFRQLKSSGLGATPLDDIRFPFYNRKRLPSGHAVPRTKPKGEIPGQMIRRWIESEDSV